jgi:hypothetical protein
LVVPDCTTGIAGIPLLPAKLSGGLIGGGLAF